MKRIFEPVALGNLPLANRLVRSATLENGAAKNGRITPLLGAIYEGLAEGGVGLIITGMMGVAPNACVHAGMVKLYGSHFEEDFAGVVQRVHQKGGKVVVQLGHCGARAKELDGGPSPLAPSDIVQPGGGAREIQPPEIAALVKAYGDAAQKCRAAGADGVQIHAAHGYLISEFLSPLFNRRSDGYGGSVENRARLLFEVYDEIRTRVGGSYPVMVKINHSDIVPGGVATEDVLWYCRELARRGIDAIEVSAGVGLDKASRSIQGGRRDEAFNAPFALALAQQVDAVVLSVGGFRSPAVIERVLNEGNLAAIALCRALIREPGLPARWQAGSGAESDCTACGLCFTSPVHGCFLAQKNA